MRNVCVVIASCLLCACALAQGVPADPGAKVFFWQQSAGPGAEMAPPPGNVIFHTQRNGDGKFTTSYVAVSDLGKPVTGAPYTATASTETTQVLADGNRIVNKTTTLLARDSQGRTRREEAMDAIGPLAVKGPRMVFINDPVAKATYILDLNRQTADVIQTSSGPVKQVVTNGPIGVSGTRVNVERKVILRGGPESGADRGGTEAGVEQRVFMISDEAGQAKTESLGTQVIEGVTAEGKRVTRTIPAGQIGNERPIEITSEVWTSPELQMIIMSKRNDPRVGETIYRLTDIKRGEPEHSLFEVPANFSTGMKSVD